MFFVFFVVVFSPLKGEFFFVVEKKKKNVSRPLAKRKKATTVSLSLPHSLTCPGHRGDPARLRGPPRRRLVPHGLYRLRPRPDEGDPLLLAAPRERRVLGEEAVAGVDDVDAVGLGDGDDALDVEVGLEM